MTTILRALAASACLLLPQTGLATAQDAPGADPAVAVIGSTVVTESDLDRALAGRGRTFGDDPDRGRARMLDTLAAEYWVDQGYRRIAEQNPQLKAALDEARRQVLFEMYAQSEFVPQQPTEAEIDAYVAAHPDFFGARISYRFERLTIPLAAGASAEDIERELAALPDGTVDPQAAARLAAALAAEGLRFNRTTLWTGGEALAAPLRDRLQGMAGRGAALEAVRGEDAYDILFLYEARPEPIDPALLRQDIANRLVQEQYQAHRAALAAQVAKPLIEAAATWDGSAVQPVAAGPVAFDDRTLGWLAGLGASTGLAIATLMAWGRKSRLLFRLARRENEDDGLSLRQRPALAMTLSRLLALAALGGTGYVLYVNRSLMTGIPGIAAVAGLALLGLVLGLLLWRGQPETVPRMARLQRRAEAGGILLVLVHAGVCTAAYMLL